MMGKIWKTSNKSLHVKILLSFNAAFRSVCREPEIKSDVVYPSFSPSVYLLYLRHVSC